MASLSQTDINALVAKIKKFPYLVTAVLAGGTTSITGQTITAATVSLGPLAGAPTAEPDVETNDITLYETGADIQAKLLTKNSVTLTIRTRNIDDAMELIKLAKKDENVYDPAYKQTITLVPITGATGEKAFTFTNAFLNPGLSCAPGEGNDPNSVTLTYECKADASTGVPFTYATPST